MDLTKQQIAEAFSSHDFRNTYPYLAGNITWTMVGGEQLVGRDQVVRTCEESARYLDGVETRFSRFRVLAGADWVVVDTEAAYEGADGEKSVVASCDIFEFAGAMVVNITSYNIELGG